MKKVLIISADGHVAATPEGYRPYIPQSHLQEFDGWLEKSRGSSQFSSENFAGEQDVCWHSEKRLAAIESEGVVAEVLFPNGAPFGVGFFGEGPLDTPEHWTCIAGQTYNRWLADFCAAAPGRRAGIAQIPFFDVKEAVSEIRWAHANGLKGIGLLNLRPGEFFFDDRLNPIWETCEELGMVLNQHSTTYAYGPGYAGLMTVSSEAQFYTSRSLVQLIFGGIFERFPGLKYVITEGLADWIPGQLRYMDSCVHSRDWGHYAMISKMEPPIKRDPSTYFETNCYVGCSSMSREETILRYSIGTGKMMFGTDFPHFEATSPATKDWIRATLGYSRVPETEVRQMLGETAAAVYGFDSSLLAPHVDRVGPELSELMEPLDSANGHLRGVLRAARSPVPIEPALA